MIRVLHIVTIMNRSGLESRLMDIYRNIDRNKIQYDFYTNRMESGEFDSEIEKLGGKVYHSNAIRPGKELQKKSEFKRFLLDHPEYNIIHAHVNEWSTIFCKAAKEIRIPTIIAHSRGANTDFTLKTAYKNILRIPIKNYVTHCFAVSEKAGEHLFGKRAVKQGKVKVLPNAIDTEKYRLNNDIRLRKRKELGLDSSFVVIHVGRFEHQKNHIFLLEIFNIIHKERPNAKLLLIGNTKGSLYPKTVSWVHQHGLDNNVIFLGERKDVSELLQSADFFIFPSFHEGFPGAALEAETSGLPCLISDSVTQEIVLTDRVKQMSLKSSADMWAKETMKMITRERTDCVETIKSAGYDIYDLSRRMENFYMRCDKKVKNNGK